MDRESQLKDYKSKRNLLASNVAFEIDRDDILKRLASTLKRFQHNHFILVGEQGSGRSFCLKQFRNYLSKQAGCQNYHMIYFDLGQLALQHQDQALTYLQNYCQELDLSNQDYIICLDELERFQHYQPSDWLNCLAWLTEQSAASPHHFGLCLTKDLYYQYLANDYTFKRQFEAITLTPPSTNDLVNLIESFFNQQQTQNRWLSWPQHFINHLIEAAQQYVPIAMPAGALQLADQLLGHACQISNHKKIFLDHNLLNQVLASWYGIQPQSSPILAPERLLRLAQQLNEHIMGQKEALNTIQQTLLNQQFNITQPSHVTTFIFEGPANVGKTFTARVLTQQLLGSQARSAIINLSTINIPSLMRLFDQQLRQNRVTTFVFTQTEQANHEVLIYLQQLIEDSVFYNNNGQPFKIDQKLFIFTYQQTNQTLQSDANTANETNSTPSPHLQLVLHNLPDEEPLGDNSQPFYNLEQINLPDPLLEMSSLIHFNQLTISDREFIAQNNCQQLAQKAMIRYGVILQFEARFSYRFLRQYQLQQASPQLIQAELQHHLKQLLNQHLSFDASHQWQELLIQINDQGQLSAQAQKRLM